jgi:hypothetical protein
MSTNPNPTTSITNPASLPPAIAKWITTLIAAWLMRKVTSLDSATAGDIAQLVIGIGVGIATLLWTYLKQLKIGRAQQALAEHAPISDPIRVDAVAKAA